MGNGEVVTGRHKGEDGRPVDIERFSEEIRERIDIGDLSEEEFKSVVGLAAGVWDEGPMFLRRTYGSEAKTEIQTEAFPGDTIDDGKVMSYKLASLVGQQEEWRERLKTKRIQNARKVFLAGIFEKARETGNEEAAARIRDGLFGDSEDLMHGAGDLFDYVELYEMVKESKVASRFFEGHIRTVIEYDNSFSYDDIVKDLFNQEPVRIARFMPMVVNLTKGAMGRGFNHCFYDKTSEALTELMDESPSAFIRVAAEAMIDQLYYQDRVTIELLDEKEGSVVKSAKRNGSAEEDAYGLTGRLEESSLSRDERQFLKALHEPSIKYVVEDELGISINDLTIGAQNNLMKFMVESGDDRYDRLRNALSSVGDKTILAESFLALDFGEDFGETLLRVSETTKDLEILSEILASIDHIRGGAKDFAEIFRGKVATDAERAIGERMTEILHVVLALNQNGIASADRFGETIETVDYNEVVKTLGYVETALSKIELARSSQIARQVFGADGVSMYQLGESGDVLLKTRAYSTPEGEYSPEFEYASEAQVNFGVNVLNDDPVPPELSEEARDRALSIRIDREGLLLDESGKKIGYDPMLENLTAALDLGTFNSDEGSPNAIVGKIVAIGNFLRAKENQKVGRGYHTSLGAELRPKEAFAQMVREVQEWADALAWRQTVARFGQTALGEAA